MPPAQGFRDADPPFSVALRAPAARGRAGRRGLLAGLLVVVTGCAVSSSGGGGTGSAGTGGVSGVGGGAGGTIGGSGPGPGDGAAPLTENEVCRAAIRVQCERSVACVGGDLESCMRVASLCPDYYFNADSTRTVAGVAACLGALGARTCTDLTLGLYPSCFARGKRPAGAGCAYPSQCQSGGCANGTVCATCAAGGVPVGGSCTGAVCQSGSFCLNGLCTDGATVVHATEGQPCDLGATPVVGCAGDLRCITASSGTKAGLCTRAPGKGEPCAQIAGAACVQGTACSGTDGGTCMAPNECGPGTVCDATSYCSKGDGGATCAPRAAVGQPCTTSVASPCLAPAICLAATSRCTVLRVSGESCAADNPCEFPLSCQSGTCRPLGSQSCPADGSGTGAGGTGGTPAPTVLSASATRDFGNVEVGVTSGAATWTVTNTGPSPTGTLALNNGNATEISVGANTCTGTLAAGASCTVTVAFRPSAGGLRSGTLSLSATPGGTVTFGATARGQYRLTVTVTGGGTVTSEPAGLNCGTTCSMLVSSSVTLKAVTTNGSNLLFTGWTGACAGPVRDCPVSVNAASSVVATFSPLTANLVFTSSRRVPPNKESLAAYDADCNALATAAGINNTAGNGYVAFMSDATTAAPARIPASARGWVRIDGKPFADTLASLSPGHKVFNPIAFDELGKGGVSTLTGTNTDGSAKNTCDSWTSAADTSFASLGSYTGGPGAWAYIRADAYCSQATNQPTYGVICMGTTRNSAVSPVVTAGKKLWVTSTGFIPGAGQTPDAKCQAEKPAGVTTAIALLATTTQSAGSRLEPTATYVRVDGTLVGTGAQIASRTFSSGVWQFADGTYRATATSDMYPYAWTGAPSPSVSGSATETCANWTDSAGTGLMGDWTDANLRWGALTASPCTRPFSLFCVQSAP